jgi:hypothetical protein
MDNQSNNDSSVLVNNVFLVIIAVLFLIFVLYRSGYDCRVESNHEGYDNTTTNTNTDNAVEGYRDSRSLLRPGTGPVGYSIPSSNLDKTLQGDYHLTQYAIDEAFGTEYSNVKLLTERIADKIAEFTLRVVVGPCMNAENLRGLDARLECIRGYPHYYTDMLKYPLLEMFSKMDEFEIDPFKKGILKREDQQYQAMVGLVQAYAKSLDSSLKVMATKYEELGFIPEEFRVNLSYVLSQWFLFRLTQIFRNPDLKWSTLGASDNDGSSIVSSSDFDTAPTGLPMDTIGLTPMEKGTWSVSCPDLNSGAINVSVSGRRLRCGPMENKENIFYVNS